MAAEVAAKCSNPAAREMLSDKSKLLTPEATVTRLIAILELNKFENGARVDYHDSG